MKKYRETCRSHRQVSEETLKDRWLLVLEILANVLTLLILILTRF